MAPAMFTPLPNVVSLSLKAVTITYRSASWLQGSAGRTRQRHGDRRAHGHMGTGRSSADRQTATDVKQTCRSAGEIWAPALACTLQLGSKMTWWAIERHTPGKKRGNVCVREGSRPGSIDLREGRHAYGRALAWQARMRCGRQRQLRSVPCCLVVHTGGRRVDRAYILTTPRASTQTLRKEHPA